MGTIYKTGFYAVLALLLQSSMKYQINGQKPVEEVVSIYNENFTTPHGREPYFIKVLRCIVTDEEVESVCMNTFPTGNKTKIEIVVPDLNNPTKFYQYNVFNYTNCTCVNGPGDSPEKLHETLTSNEVTRTEFEAKVRQNPVNLRDCKTSFCEKPHRRYKVHPGGLLVMPQHRMMLYHQCLPGCPNTTVTVKKFAYLRKDGAVNGTIADDIECEAYDKNFKSPNSTSPSSIHGQQNDSSMDENGFIIKIGSTKFFLAAFVLSVILLSILIVDFNLCHRKKGLFYTVFCCGTKKVCQECAQRRVDEIV